MSDVEELWNRHLSRSYDGPDGIELDEEKVTFRLAEDLVMAVETALPEDQFNTVVRWIKRTEVDKVSQLLAMLDAGMKRLGLRGNYRKAVVGEIPAGSDHLDTGSINDWMARIEKADKAAKRQVVALHATAFMRVKGS